MSENVLNLLTDELIKRGYHVSKAYPDFLFAGLTNFLSDHDSIATEMEGLRVLKQTMIDGIEPQESGPYYIDVVDEVAVALWGQPVVEAARPDRVRPQINLDVDCMQAVAIDLVVREQVVSVSFVQRSLDIAYGRARDIVDQMEALNIISGMDSHGRRKVLHKAEG